ncbi:hypothetical protein ABH904_001238 [Pseudomonas frederiksbergensis]
MTVYAIIGGAGLTQLEGLSDSSVIGGGHGLWRTVSRRTDR